MENNQRYHTLTLRKTDVDGALHRCCDNEKLYETCLETFLYDETVEELNDAVNAKKWDDAFTAAHALKGLAGNMGFIPLMHATSQLVVVIRGGKLSEVGQAMEGVNSSYRDIVDGIEQFLAY